jgi:hypothetical protein
MEHDDTTTSLSINIKSRKQFYNLIFLSFILYHQIEPISKHPLLPNICVPDERDLRFDRLKF